MAEETAISEFIGFTSFLCGRDQFSIRFFVQETLSLAFLADEAQFDFQFEMCTNCTVPKEDTFLI